MKLVNWYRNWYTYHSGGLNGILLLNSRTSAARTQSTIQTITGTSISSWMPHAPKINGNIPHAIAPHANCRPISDRPVDVSRVAIITAVFNSTMTDTGMISAIERINKYDQYVTSISPSIYRMRKTNNMNTFDWVNNCEWKCLQRIRTYFETLTLCQHTCVGIWIGHFALDHWFAFGISCIIFHVFDLWLWDITVESICHLNPFD